MRNTLMSLSDEQKLLLIYTINVLNMRRGNDGNNDFDRLLENQNEEILDAIINLQNSMIYHF